MGIRSERFHGKISMAKRLEVKARWQREPNDCALLMSRECGNTGYNLEQADTVLSVDWDWVPDKHQQSEARMLRAGWHTDERIGRLPRILQYTSMGTVEQYMRQWVELKARGIDQAVDRIHTEEFDASEFLTYRDFSIKMLRAEGYLDED